jgi:membrane associated rhomboid family serine protease
MFIPLGTDRPAKRPPRVTQALIAVNVAVHVGIALGVRSGQFSFDQVLDALQFNPRDFSIVGLFTAFFVHSPGIWHIAFNMLFLAVFGAAVESRLGRAGFIGFYLAGGVVANLAHMAVSASPVIGASGAVAAVTGAFLALFPRARIKVLFIFFIIGIYHVPAPWFIGLYFVIDVLRQFVGLFGGAVDRVAYMAHIAGYVFGFGLALVLLATGVLNREELDIFYLFKQSRRRAAFRAANRKVGGGLWDTPQADTGRHIERKMKEAPPPDPRLASLRAEIRRLAAAHDLPAACERYRALLAEDEQAVLTEGLQLDLANAMLAEGDTTHAARGYELYLGQYPRSTRSDEVRLMLAVIYVRHLGRPDDARPLLDGAPDRLSDASQRSLAETLLAEVGAAGS